MKLLRETIRKIILENNSEYSSLVQLIINNDLERVRQGIELGEDVGLLQDLRYTVEAATRITMHIWHFSLPIDFLEALRTEYYEFNEKADPYAHQPLSLLFPPSSSAQGEISAKLRIMYEEIRPLKD